MSTRKNLKIYVVGGRGFYNYPSWITLPYKIVDDIRKANLVFFCGGADISPSIYNEEKHHSTFENPKRDEEEIIIFSKAQELGIKCIGICRGSQLLCSLSGGKLVQDMLHPGWHQIKTLDGQEFRVISTHHQMQYPFNLKKEDYTLIGWATNLSPYHIMNPSNNIEMMPKEAEIVHYKKTNCLCVQAHPEMMPHYSPFVEYANQLLTQFLTNTLFKQQTK